MASAKITRAIVQTFEVDDLSENYWNDAHKRTLSPAEIVEQEFSLDYADYADQMDNPHREEVTIEIFDSEGNILNESHFIRSHEDGRVVTTATLNNSKKA